MPSLAPSTAARSQPTRLTWCRSLILAPIVLSNPTYVAPAAMANPRIIRGIQNRKETYGADPVMILLGVKEVRQFRRQTQPSNSPSRNRGIH